MKVEIELPELPKGYEYTGEYREPFYEEMYAYRSHKGFVHIYANTGSTSSEYPIVRAITTTRTMTAKEIAMLPRGTAFFWQNYAEYGIHVYSVKQEDGSEKTFLNNYSVDRYQGYKLPTDSDDDPVRPFTVEE